MTEGWSAPDVDRVDPDRIADERAALEQWLDFQRATLLRKCAGLGADQLRQRAVPPSRLSLLGLVRHMVEVERWWFGMHAGRLDLQFPYDPEGTCRDIEGIDDADAAANLDDFVRECEASRQIAAPLSLDDTFPSRGDHPERVRDLRWIYVHMIEEYARHNGHADLLREVIDGATGV
jgi:uncharacterized damage-inducible protein DinB